MLSSSATPQGGWKGTFSGISVCEVALVGQMERELVVERQWLLIAYPLLQPTWVMVQ
jgi:hypothetical protein